MEYFMSSLNVSCVNSQNYSSLTADQFEADVVSGNVTDAEVIEAEEKGYISNGQANNLMAYINQRGSSESQTESSTDGQMIQQNSTSVPGGSPLSFDPSSINLEA